MLYQHNKITKTSCYINGIKLFGSKLKLMGKTKNDENVPSIEVVAVFLVRCNLVDNQY